MRIIFKCLIKRNFARSAETSQFRSKSMTSYAAAQYAKKSIILMIKIMKDRKKGRKLKPRKCGAFLCLPALWMHKLLIYKANLRKNALNCTCLPFAVSYKTLIYKAFFNLGLDDGRQTCLSFDIEHTRQRDLCAVALSERLYCVLAL